MQVDRIRSSQANKLARAGWTCALGLETENLEQCRHFPLHADFMRNRSSEWILVRVRSKVERVGAILFACSAQNLSRKTRPEENRSK